MTASFLSYSQNYFKRFAFFVYDSIIVHMNIYSRNFLKRISAFNYLNLNHFLMVDIKTERRSKMNRTAIIVDKKLTLGQQANLIAILSAAISSHTSDVIAPNKIIDLNGNLHAAIKNNVVVLKANPTAILTLTVVLKEISDIEFIVFSKEGQNSSDRFSEYKNTIARNGSKDLGIVGVALYGDSDKVKQATKKFSLLH